MTSREKSSIYLTPKLLVYTSLEEVGCLDFQNDLNGRWPIVFCSQKLLNIHENQKVFTLSTLLSKLYSST